MEEKNLENKRNKFKELLNKKIEKQDILYFFKNNWLNIYIIINILYILIVSFLAKINMIFFCELSYGYSIFFVSNIIAIIILLLTQKYKKDILHIFVVLVMLFAIISTIFAKNVHVALYGFMDRWEGLFVILYYVSLMFLSSFVEKRYKKIIVYFILFSGIIQAVYGILQVYNFPNISKSHHSWATGFTQNPNFFGTYMLLCLCYSIGLYVDETNNLKKVLFIITSMILMVGLLISNTSSVVVGLIVVFGYLLYFCIKKKKMKKIFTSIIIVIFSIIITTSVGKTNVVKDLEKTAKEATEVAKGNTDDKFGSSRMFIWKETIKIIPKYWLHGAGIDNFYFAFGQEPLRSHNGKVVYDKVHNEYLQTLVTQGIFSIISYLILYTVIIKNGIKNSLKNEEVYLILPIIGYVVQAFFNISVIEVAPIFYMALGLCSNNMEE